MLKYQQLFQELRVKWRDVGQEGFIKSLSLSFVVASKGTCTPAGPGFTGAGGICLDRIAQ